MQTVEESYFKMKYPFHFMYFLLLTNAGNVHTKKLSVTCVKWAEAQATQVNDLWLWWNYSMNRNAWWFLCTGFKSEKGEINAERGQILRYTHRMAVALLCQFWWIFSTCFLLNEVYKWSALVLRQAWSRSRVYFFSQIFFVLVLIVCLIKRELCSIS